MAILCFARPLRQVLDRRVPISILDDSLEMVICKSHKSLIPLIAPSIIASVPIYLWIRNHTIWSRICQLYEETTCLNSIKKLFSGNRFHCGYLINLQNPPTILLPRRALFDLQVRSQVSQSRTLFCKFLILGEKLILSI